MAIKTGRNDPCPCGSGKKYKHCCLLSDGLGDSGLAGLRAAGVRLDESSERLLGDEIAMREYRDHVEALGDGEDIPSFMEFMGAPNLATNFSRQLEEAAKGKIFENTVEAQKFLDDFSRQQNNAPRKDFMGLSPEKMRRILGAEGWDDIEDFVAIREGDLPVPSAKASLPAIARSLLRRYGENPSGLKITATGNFGLALVEEIVEECLDYPDVGRLNEDQVEELAMVHDFMRFANLVEETASKSRLSAKGAELAREPAGLWRELLDFILFRHDWRDFTFGDLDAAAVSHIQDSALFSLYLIEALPGESFAFASLYEAFVRAFPRYEADGLAEFDLGAIIYQRHFVDLFAVGFGFLEETASKPARNVRICAYRKTPLFHQALIWKRMPAV